MANIDPVGVRLNNQDKGRLRDARSCYAVAQRRHRAAVERNDIRAQQEAMQEMQRWRATAHKIAGSGR